MRTTMDMIYSPNNLSYAKNSKDNAAALKENTGSDSSDKYMDYANSLINEQLQRFSIQIMQQSSMLNYDSNGFLGGQQEAQAPQIEGGFKNFYKEMELGKLDISDDDKKKLELLFSTGQRLLTMGRSDMARDRFSQLESLINTYEDMDSFTDFAKKNNLENLGSKKLKELKGLFDKMNQFTVNGDTTKAQASKEALYAKIGKTVSYPEFESFIDSFKLDEAFEDDETGKAKALKKLRVQFDKYTDLRTSGKTRQAAKEQEKLYDTLNKYVKYKPFDSISKALDLRSMDISSEEMDKLELDYNKIRKMEGLGQSDRASEQWNDFISVVDQYIVNAS